MLKKIMVSFSLVAVFITSIAQARSFNSEFLDNVQFQNVHYTHDTHSSSLSESSRLLILSSENPQAWSQTTIKPAPFIQTAKQSIRRFDPNVKENTLAYFSSENPAYSKRPAFVSDTVLRKSYERTHNIPRTFRAVPYFDKVTRANFKDYELVKEKERRAIVKALRYRAVFEGRRR